MSTVMRTGLYFKKYSENTVTDKGKDYNLIIFKILEKKPEQIVEKFDFIIGGLLFLQKIIYLRDLFTGTFVRNSNNFIPSLEPYYVCIFDSFQRECSASASKNVHDNTWCQTEFQNIYGQFALSILQK